MRWKLLTKNQKILELAEKQCRWHRWFAWYPVKISQNDEKAEWCWFEMVGRRKTLGWKYIGRGLRTNQVALYNTEYCHKEDIVARALEENELKDERR